MGKAGDSHGAGSSVGGGGRSSGAGGGGGLAGSWGRSGYDPGSMGIQSGLGRKTSGGGLAGIWGRTGYDPKKQGVQSNLSGTLGQPTATQAATTVSVQPTVSVNPQERAAALGARVSITTPQLGALESFLSKPATAHMRDLSRQLGPGAVTEDKTFEPERGILGTVRDVLTPGKETQIGVGLAATAYNKGVLGELTKGIRSGVVGTEERGTRAKRDPVGQALSVLDVAQSVFGLPSPRQMMNPVGAAFGVAPVAGAAYSLYNLAEEQATLGKIAEAGMFPDQKRTQRTVAVASQAGTPTGGVVTDLGQPVAGATTVAAEAVKPEGFDEEMIRRTALRGFGSTRRTGAYGITGPLAVRA